MPAQPLARSIYVERGMAAPGTLRPNLTSSNGSHDHPGLPTPCNETDDDVDTPDSAIRKQSCG